MSRKGLAGTQNSNCQMSRTQVILLPCSDHHKLFLARRSHPGTVQGNCAWDLICEFFSLNAHRRTVKISSRSKQPCVRFYFLNFLRCQYNCILKWEQQFAISTWNKQQQCWQFSKYTPSAAREFDVAGSYFGAWSRWVLIPDHNFLHFHMQQILCFLKIYLFGLMSYNPTLFTLLPSCQRFGKHKTCIFLTTKISMPQTSRA
jgi:hypothetical protein